MLTEADWLSSDVLEPMLEVVRGRASARQLRLFACACVRRLGALLVGERHRATLLAAEAFAEGKGSARHIEATWSGPALARGEASAAKEAAWAVDAAGYLDACTAAQEAAGAAARAVWHACGTDEGPAQCRLLRDIVGNPFRPVHVEPSWLAWGGGIVVSLARCIYEERAFERLPILADALEDAGCCQADILGHCRLAAEHVRGCWVLDRLLGRA
jgi:hypothetical protein